MTRNSRPLLSRQARSDAGEWLLLLREHEADPEVRAGFLAWIRQSPENVHAFLRMLAAWEATGLLQKSSLFDLQEILRQAEQSSNVFEIEPLAARGSLDEAPPRKTYRTPVRVAVAAALLVAIGATVFWFQIQKNTYTTGIGEQRTVALQDGSTIVLNSKSRVRVHLTQRQRDIDLLEGQALFRVAHNATRAFVVHSGSTNVSAVGTEFDVYRKPADTVVTVLEGAVAVFSPDLSPVLPKGQGGAAYPTHPKPSDTSSSPSSPGRGKVEVLLSAGEQITVSPLETTPPKSADIAIATAWTQGKLIFKNTPLSEVVSEFNRYSSRRLIIEADALNQLHVTGVFSSSDPGRLAELLQQRFGLSIRESDNEIRVFQATQAP